MHEKHLYEYAVIRIVPLIEREEFVNAGIILFSKKARFISVQFEIDEKKLRCFSADIDIDQVRLNLQSFEKIAHGTSDSGPIGQMDLASRFRWLTAVRSSIIQTSRTHPGLCNDLEGTVKRLFAELVL
jgi:hypothetical protein